MRTRRGYSLIEILMVLGLLGIFALAAGQLFVTSFHITEHSADQIESAARFDAALTLLREDIQNSSSWNTADPNHLHVESDQKTIEWKIDPDHTLSREAQHWSLDRPISFAAEGKLLVVKVSKNQIEDLVIGKLENR